MLWKIWIRGVFFISVAAPLQCALYRAYPVASSSSFRLCNIPVWNLRIARPLCSRTRALILKPWIRLHFSFVRLTEDSTLLIQILQHNNLSFLFITQRIRLKNTSHFDYVSLSHNNCYPSVTMAGFSVLLDFSLNQAISTFFHIHMILNINFNVTYYCTFK